MAAAVAVAEVVVADEVLVKGPLHVQAHLSGQGSFKFSWLSAQCLHHDGSKSSFIVADFFWLSRR